jgi:threonine/homoserine/homoserine lactone efflux protein
MDVSGFVVAALLLELTPGTNMAYLATLSLTRGRYRGAAAVRPESWYSENRVVGVLGR